MRETQTIRHFSWSLINYIWFVFILDYRSITEQISSEIINNLKCIIHSENQVSYSEIKSLTEMNRRRISEAREKRNELGGKNNHFEQITQIAEKIDRELHGVHLEPCYKRS